MSSQRGKKFLRGHLRKLLREDKLTPSQKLKAMEMFSELLDDLPRKKSKSSLKDLPAQPNIQSIMSRIEGVH